MTTPLPEPATLSGQYCSYTVDQLRKYGEAEYRRGIEDAANVCDATVEFFRGSETLHPLQTREAETAQSLAIGIRKLGETS